MQKIRMFMALMFISTCFGCGGNSTEYKITYHLDDGINDDNPLTYVKTMKTIKLKKSNES